MLIPEREALPILQQLLERWLGPPPPKLRAPGRADQGVDLLAEWGGQTLAVEYKARGDGPSIARALEQLGRYGAGRRTGFIRVVAVPFMGDLGKRLCSEAGASWIDLSGNAHVVGHGLRIFVEGQPNRFRSPGRPSSAFAPTSARIARHLLLSPHRAVRQQQLARETGLDDGFTSKIVRRLEADGLVRRDPDGAVRPTDPDLLLDAWAEHYDFGKHRIVRGHVGARSGEELVERLGAAFAGAGLEHAATGLAAAWLRTKFASFRIATFFVAEEPAQELLGRVGFRPEPRGSNTWLVVPNDADVFAGAERVGGVRCVHPLQCYLDLASHPERANEAAAELRSRELRWRSA